MTFRQAALATVILHIIAYPVEAHAEQPGVLDVVELYGEAGLAFPSAAGLNLKRGGTVELWLGADWTDTLSYDPVIVSYAGPEGVLYQVSVSRSRDGLIIQAGDLVADVGADLSGDVMHHVAVLDYGDLLVFMVDGRYAGASDMHFADFPATGLNIGNDASGNAPFVGAIASLRIWDEPLDPDEVIRFAHIPSASLHRLHPSAGFLVGYSDFTTGGFVLTLPEGDRP